MTKAATELLDALQAERSRPEFTGSCLREARSLLGWSRTTLSRKSRVAVSVISRAEDTVGEPPITVVHLDSIRRALEAAGVEFVQAADGGSGVRLRVVADPGCG